MVDEGTGLPQVAVEGSRIKTVALIDPETGEDIVIARDGVLTEAAPESIRMVTLDFLVETNGDNYPFQELSTDIQYLTRDGGTTPDEDDPNILEEQEALTDFFEANHADEDSAFDEAETDVANDTRVVQLARNGGEDRILLDENQPKLDIEVTQVLDSGETELFTGGSEVVSVEDGLAFVTNGAQNRIDVFDTATGESCATSTCRASRALTGCNRWRSRTASSPPRSRSHPRTRMVSSRSSTPTARRAKPSRWATCPTW